MSISDSGSPSSVALAIVEAKSSVGFARREAVSSVKYWNISSSAMPCSSMLVPRLYSSSSLPKSSWVSLSMNAKSETRDFLWFLAKLAVFVFVLRSFIVSPFNIPSESMQPRLLIGDYLLVAKWPYGYSRYSLPFGVPLIPGRIFASTPERGDVVVFKAPPSQKNDYIKRVIGLPGDMISVRGGTVYLNGQAIPKQKVADLVIPVTPNMIDAAAKEGSPSPCYRPKFEEAAPGGGRQCRYPQYRETLPNGKSYNVLDLVPDGAADDRDTVVVPDDDSNQARGLLILQSAGLLFFAFAGYARIATLAEEVRRRVPAAQKVRFVSTGTEATMTAVRLARGATGRDLVVKFAGCYHGHSDGLLAAAGSGLATGGLPGSAGVTQAKALYSWLPMMQNA